MARSRTTPTRLAGLIREAVETQARLGREYAELVRATATTDSDRIAVGRAYFTSVRRESERYWRGFSDLGLGYAEDVVALNSRVGLAVVDDVRSALRKSGESAAGSAPSGHASEPDGSRRPTRTEPEVTLRGPLGGTATGRVTVANKHPRTRRITLTPSILTDMQGHVVGAVVRSDPKTVTVPAGQETELTLSVDLDPSAFTVGGEYTGSLELSGGAEATLRMVLHVDPAN